jgi:TolB protein
MTTKRLFKSVRLLAIGTIAWALCMAILPSAHGATRKIVIEGSSKNPIYIRGISGNYGQQAASDLKADLVNSGVIKLSESLDGSFVAFGNVEGKSLVGTLNSPDGSVMINRTYGADSLKANVHAFSADIIGMLGGDVSLAGTRIVFVGKRTGFKELYVCDFDGSNLRQLTSDKSITVSPSLSPDGNTVAHTSYRGGYADVYLLSMKSGSRNRVIKAPGTNSGAAISPDGNRMALTMSHVGNPEIFVTSTNGNGAKRITNSPGVDSSPTWSPDGSKLAFSSDRGGSPNIYISSSSGGGARQVSTGYGHCTEPNWSPDGRRLAFCVRQGGGFAIAVHDLGSGKSRILGSGEDPCWAPDSKHIVFASGGSLVVTDADGGGNKTIAGGMGDVSEPSWAGKVK